MGCSTQSVPSWSKVAIRSSGGTNLGLPCSVVTRTKSRIACFAGPSFHDARDALDAVCAWATAGRNVPDRAGSRAKLVTKVRRSIPGDNSYPPLVQSDRVHVGRTTGG